MLPLVFLALLTSAALADAPARIVVLGEVHDNAAAHAGQAEVLAALRPRAVVFEMLTDDAARRARAEPARIPEIWAASGWPDFALYAPLFEALGPAAIFGAAAPRAHLGAVYENGPAALFGPDAPRYGLDLPLPRAEQAAREALQFEAHCAAMPRAAMGGMVAVQRYRDALLARAALEALDRYGPPVAVIAGNGHARVDWGVPVLIARAAPHVTTHAVAFVEGETDMPFDEVRIVPPVERDDPCAALTGG